MKAFSIFESQLGDLKAVKSGWSWPAFFTQMFGVGWVWAFLKGQITTGLLLLLWALMCCAALQTPEALSLTGLINIILFITLGAKGNQWTCNALSKKGYVYKDMVMAGNKSMAEMVALKERKERNESN